MSSTDAEVTNALVETYANTKLKNCVPAPQPSRRVQFLETSWVPVKDLVTPHPVGRMLCNECEGSGTLPPLFMLPRDCDVCDGTGWMGGKTEGSSENNNGTGPGKTLFSEKVKVKIEVAAHRLETQEKAAVRLLRKGHTAASVAQHKSVQVHPTTVQRWATKHGIQLKYPYNRHAGRDDLVSISEILRLRKRRNAGKPLFTLAEIADLCDCSRSYVKQVCAKARAEGQL